MFKKKLLSLLFVSTYLCSQFVPPEVDDLDVEHTESRGSKCKKYRNLTVCNALKVLGSVNTNNIIPPSGTLAVNGSITANSFITPSGALFNGLLITPCYQIKLQ